MARRLKETKTVILGAGLSGLAAGRQLQSFGYDAGLYEKNAYVGGHAASFHTDGFTFDEGPHVSFTKNHRIKSLLAEAVNHKYTEQNAGILNYWKGHLIQHPAQTHLYGLPAPLIKRCLNDLEQARKHPRKIRNYADWCFNRLGAAFSKEFAFRYTRKYWAAEADKMAGDWVGTRVYSPSLREMERGAHSLSSANEHYILKFRYPDAGGFGAYGESLSGGLRVNLGCEVRQIDLKKKTIEFKNKKTAGFDQLISTLPLPELIARIKSVPKDVQRAADQLVCTSLVLVNVGIQRRNDFPKAHWMYFYDQDIIFSRGIFPHKLSSNNAPKGCGSIQLEIYHSRYRRLPCKDVLSKAMEDLKKSGLLLKSDRVLLAREMRVPYANVLFDVNREKALRTVKNYLKSKRVFSCGRYGEWAYFWTDDSILSGQRAADDLMRKEMNKN